MGDLTPGWKFGENERGFLVWLPLSPDSLLVVPDLEPVTRTVHGDFLRLIFFLLSFLTCATDVQTAADTLAV